MSELKEVCFHTLGMKSLFTAREHEDTILINKPNKMNPESTHTHTQNDIKNKLN